MTEDDIANFIKTFDSFMNNSETFIFEYYERTNPMVQQMKIDKIAEYEKRAAELEVTVDYYMEEFLS
jgi:hypothetical protein